MSCSPYFSINLVLAISNGADIFVCFGRCQASLPCAHLSYFALQWSKLRVKSSFLEVPAGKTAPRNPGDEVSLLYPQPALFIRMFSKAPKSWPQIVLLRAIQDLSVFWSCQFCQLTSSTLQLLYMLKKKIHDNLSQKKKTKPTMMRDKECVWKIIIVGN